MYGFHLLVSVLCVRGILDTQCGFKMMTRAAAAELFQTMHIDRWSVEHLALSISIMFIKHQCLFDFRAFDVELLYIAQQMGMPIGEVPVNWQEVDGALYLTLYYHVSISFLCCRRIQAGPILELATNGKGYTLH